jgi:NTE family protein
MAHHAEIIPVMPDFEHPVGLRDTHLIDYLVRQGERATEREMPYLRRLLHGQGGPAAEAAA